MIYVIPRAACPSTNEKTGRSMLSRTEIGENSRASTRQEKSLFSYQAFETIHKVEGAEGLQLEGKLLVVEIQDASKQCHSGKYA